MTARALGLAALALSLGACGSGASNASASNESAAPDFRRFAELKASGFVEVDRRIVGLTAPSVMPNGTMAEGTPILGIVLRKAGSGASEAEAYLCRDPMDRRFDRDPSDADMANWKCDRIHG